MHLHDNAHCCAQQQQRGNGGGSGYNRGSNNSGHGNRCRHGDDSNTGRANTAVTVNGAYSPNAIAPVSATPITAPFTVVAAPPAPVTVSPTPGITQTVPTPYVIQSPPSGIGHPFLCTYISCLTLNAPTPMPDIFDVHPALQSIHLHLNNYQIIVYHL